MSAIADKAADLLASLALHGRTIECLPDHLRPADEAGAMAVQRSYLSRYELGGWKVGGHPSGSGWAGAPLRGQILRSPAVLSSADAASMQIEVEIALVLGQDLPKPASIDDARHSVASIHLAFELFRSSFSDRSTQDVPSVMADHFNNAGMVLGSGRAAAGSDDLSRLEVLLVRNGAKLANSATGPSLDAMLESLCWLADYATTLGRPLRRGDVILTGARIGPLSIAEAGTYAASFGMGEVSLATGERLVSDTAP